ncbi:MAG: phosphatidate cytidylyltransferase [Deltaproteobacteria bacterium]|jgi:phosphatidate cytidylyltransferase|nr:phosphatidate cytidylyltransferase [Deltaproteobacteria bacterium]
MMADSVRPKSSELSRWLVVLCVLPPSVACVLAPNKLFLLALSAVFGSLAWREYAVNLLGRERAGLFVLCEAGFLATLCGAAFLGSDGQTAGLVVALALGAAYLMHNLSPAGDKVSVNLIARYGLGQLYLTFCLSFIMLLKQLDHGANWIMLALVVTIASDTGAYYAGSKLKGPKLYPKVSPNKTVSGLLGGCLAAFIAAELSKGYLPPLLSFWQLGGLGVFLGLWGTFGDLFESAFKRAMGLKDTSGLLKGHGGVWDRIDSLLLNLPPVYFLVNWMTSP